MTNPKTDDNRYVLVTTSYRGVYVGELIDHDGQTVTLTNARMAIRWGTKNGVDELASAGPNETSKIGALALKVWLPGVTSIVDCTPAAVKAWRGAP